MKRWGLAAVGIGAYVATLVAMAPGTLLDASLQRASNGRLRLAQAQGTIWAGAGFIEIRDVGGRNAIAKEVSWRVLPVSLLRGRLVCEVTLDRAARGFPITISFSQVDLANADVNFPAAVLALAEPRLKPLRLSGEVLLHTTNLAMGRGGIRGDVFLQWRGAGSAFSPVSPLGSYELRLDGQGDTVRAVLSTSQGPIQLDGTGSWTRDRAPEFLATVGVPPPYREQLTPLLRMISVQRDEGSFELQLK